MLKMGHVARSEFRTLRALISIECGTFVDCPLRKCAMSNTSDTDYPTEFGGRDISYVYSTDWLKDRSLIRPRRETYTTPDGQTTTQWLTFTLLRDATFRDVVNDQETPIHIKEGATWMYVPTSEYRSIPVTAAWVAKELPEHADRDDLEEVADEVNRILGGCGTWPFVPYKGLPTSWSGPSDAVFRPDCLKFQGSKASQEPTGPSAPSSSGPIEDKAA
ncbi:hypothetical protein JCM24511_03116 [Saitozyma sp. JCM 24511]|nr:hypothetical protein JCM24511_03116 [Saitozyma sp. JCM 24511]